MTTMPAFERPLAHLCAPDTWLNDPNGLVALPGPDGERIWHAYFQNNPFGVDWGNMSWGHALSGDLVNWSLSPVALPCNDQEDVYSGSCVVDTANTLGLPPDQAPALVAVYTAHYRQLARQLEATSLAVSHDGGTSFQRLPGNPVLDRQSANFRDPKVFWYEEPAAGPADRPAGHWVMVAVEAEDQQVLVHISPNLRDWTLTQTFGPAGARSGAWECPDLVRLSDPASGQAGWALLVSINTGGRLGPRGSGTQVFLGDFDGRAFTPWRVPQTDSDADWLDWGPDSYAAVTWGNLPADEPAVVMGWMSAWAYTRVTPLAGGRNAMTLPRELSLDVSGRVPAIRQVIPASVLASLGDVRELPASGADEPLGMVSLHCPGAAEVTLGGLRIERRDGRLSILRDAAANVPIEDFGLVASIELPDGPADLELVIDTTSLELFADAGRRVLTVVRFPLERCWALAGVGVRGSYRPWR